MSLDLSKLQNIRRRGQKITARCPACDEFGHDKKGEHLLINAEGRFGCVLYPGGSAAAKGHRKRIFSLAGDRDAKPLIVHPAEKAAASGRLGHPFQTDSAGARCKTGLLERLERTFETHLGRHQDALPAAKQSGNMRSVLTVLKPEAKPGRPLTEGELLLLRCAGAENDPLIITALNLFDGTIIG